MLQINSISFKLLQDINIGVNLQRLRLERNYSQADVARKLHLLGRSISVSQCSHIEQGRKNIFVSDLILLAEDFDADFNEFFVGLR